MKVKARCITVRSLVDAQIPARTYVTHGLDKYPAKMVPHMARYAIEEVSKPGDTVFDPFCGCGTVLVEACLTGRESIGVDVNPVAILLARAKSAVYDVARLSAAAEAIIHTAKGLRHATVQYPEWLGYWFSPATLEKLGRLQCAIARHRVVPSLYRDLLSTCLVIAVRKCSRADPRSPKPFISKRARRERVGRHFDAYEIFREVAAQMCGASRDFIERLGKDIPVARAVLADARNVTKKSIGMVDAVITSPPYLSAQDYYRSSKLELTVAGFWREGIERSLGARIIGSGRGQECSEEKAITGGAHPRVTTVIQGFQRSSRTMVAHYLADMRRVLGRIRGCLRQDGQCCMVIGDSTIESVALPVHEWIIDAGEGVGLQLVRHEVDLIRDRRVPPQREGHSSVIDREHLLFFRKRPVKSVLKAGGGIAKMPA